MSLTDLLRERRLRRHKPTREEIEGLLGLCLRSFADAERASAGGVSSDWRFMMAYNSALSLASAVVRAEGYRPRGEGHHATLFEALARILRDKAALVAFFDDCRRKRNRLTYEACGEASDLEAAELLERARAFQRDVRAWLADKHPDLAPPQPRKKPRRSRSP